MSEVSASTRDDAMRVLIVYAHPESTSFNAAMLREQFAGYVAAAGLKLHRSQSYYDYGVSLVGDYIGYSVDPYTVEVSNAMVNDADLRLADGDVAGAIEIVNGLDPAVVAAFEPWLKTAGAHVRADAAIGSMTQTVVDRLRARLGGEDG